MKKITLGILLSVLVLGTTSDVFAQGNTASANPVVCTQEAKQCADGTFVGRMGPKCEFAKCPEEKREATGVMSRIKNVFQNREEKREEVKNKIEDRIASTTVKREERREEVKNKIEERLDRRFERATEKYLRTIEREEAIMAKIVTRIEKIKLAGGNVVEAEKYVAEAKAHLTDARTAYTSLKTLATNADNATTTKAMITEMKTAGKNVEKHLREAHKSLQKTVGSLRGVSQLKNATSTKEN